MKDDVIKTFEEAVSEAETHIMERQNGFPAFLLRLEKELGDVPVPYDDEKTWRLFSEGRYVCPLFTLDYYKRIPRPKNMDELTEYVGRGFFVDKTFTVSMLCFQAFNGMNNEKRLCFREDVDAYFEEVFELPHEETQKIVRDIRNPVREEQGKQELHDLCVERSASEEAEQAFYHEIVRTRPTLSKRPVATAYARKIYRLAYYQANYPEEYHNICKSISVNKS